MHRPRSPVLWMDKDREGPHCGTIRAPPPAARRSRLRARRDGGIPGFRVSAPGRRAALRPLSPDLGCSTPLQDWVLRVLVAAEALACCPCSDQSCPACILALDRSPIPHLLVPAGRTASFRMTPGRRRGVFPHACQRRNKQADFKLL
jgi:hypothetical protein